MAEEFRVLRPYEYHCQLISKGRRADGRALEEIRQIKLETDAIRTADSSSLVKLGNTSIVCGCSAQLSKISDKSNQADEINIHLELPPICSSPTGHRTQHTAQLLTKMLKNIFDDTNCFDRQNLFIDDLGLYWSIDVEVICLNYDGCLLDASLIAVMSALKTLRLTSKSDSSAERVFKFNSIPICSSFAIIGDHFICDPNLEEETVAQSTFSVTIEPTSQRDCHISKIGGKALTPSQMFRCIKIAKLKAATVRAQIMDMNPGSEEDAMDCA